MSMPPHPICKALLLCQKTIIEEDTGLVTLIGIFDGFVIETNGRSGPAEAYCRITEADGKYGITVEIQDLTTGNAIAGTEAIEIEVPNKLASATVIIPIPPIPFSHPGQYDFVVFANRTEIDRWKFHVNVLDD